MAAICALFLAIGLFCLWIVKDTTAHNRVQRRIAAYRSQGVPILIDDLKQPPLPDEENQAHFLVLAAAKLLTNQPYAIEAFSAPYGHEELAQMRQIVKDHQEALQLVSESQTRLRISWDIQIPATIQPLEFPQLQQMRDLATVIACAARVAAADGDFATAFFHLHQLTMLAEAVDELPSQIPRLVALGIAGMASSAAIDIAYELGGSKSEIPRNELNGLMHWLLDEQRQRESAVRATRADRVIAIWYWRGFARGGRALRFKVDEEAVYFMDKYDAVEAAYAEPRYPLAAAKVPPERKPSSRLDLSGLMVSVLDFSSIRGVVSDYRAITHQRIAAMALAIALYRHDHDGDWPDALEALTPEYLEAMPEDAMSADPRKLTYLIDRRIIYSTGADGIDHGGDETPLKSASYVSINEWMMRDAVYHLVPQPKPVIEEPE